MTYRTQRVALGLLIFCITCTQLTVAATVVHCPPMPDAVTALGQDVAQEVRQTAIGLAKATVTDTSQKTTTATRAVFAKFPNADRMLALQTMAATYCSMIQDFPPDTRAKKWLEFYDRYVLERPKGPSARPNPVPPPVGSASSTRPLNTYSYDEAVAELQTGDSRHAFAVFQQLAARGDARSAYQLGRVYQSGIGAPPDQFKAHEWYLRAANLGVPEAQHNLAVTYQNGEGTKQDEALAKLWYQQAARQGFEPSRKVLADAGERW